MPAVIRRLLATATLLCLALAWAPDLGATQPRAGSARGDGGSWGEEAGYVAGNAALGGLVGGVSALLRGRSFVAGFAGGALGGGIAYGAKRLTARRFAGAGFVGRQVGAVGASVARNASGGSGLLDTLVLPLGPLRAVVAPAALGDVRVRLDLHETSWLVSALAEDRLRLDWGRSLSAGAAVFTSDAALEPQGRNAAGVTAGGTIVLAERSGLDPRLVFAHERVHVLQTDFLKTAFGSPVEDWIARRSTLDRIPLARFVQPGVAFGLLHFPLSGFRITSPSSVLEREAGFLDSR